MLLLRNLNDTWPIDVYPFKCIYISFCMSRMWHKVNFISRVFLLLDWLALSMLKSPAFTHSTNENSWSLYYHSVKCKESRPGFELESIYYDDNPYITSDSLSLSLSLSLCFSHSLSLSLCICFSHSLSLCLYIYIYIRVCVCVCAHAREYRNTYQ